jgi:uncharacterized membrane protein YfcA
MTIQKRTRIFEIIAALLMVRPVFSILSQLSFYSDAEQIRSLIKYEFSSLLAAIALAIVIISRKYDRTWSKLLVLISLAANFCTERNLDYIKDFGGYVRSHLRDPAFLLEYLAGALMFVLGITAGIILVLTMFGKIKWKSRNSLIIYTYIMIGIMTLGALNYRFHNIYYIELVLMPCLMYELQEERDIKAILGWIGVIAALISDIFFEYLNKKAQNDSYISLLDYLNSVPKYEGIRNLVFSTALLFIPFILFERKEKLERVIIPVDDDNDEEDNDDNND